MADRSVVASNTFEQFRVEFNELAADVGDIASITGASGTIASATDVIEAVVQINNALDAADLDGAGDSGTFAVDLDTQSLTIAGTTNEIETVASGQTLTIGLPNAVTISGTMTAGDLVLNDGSPSIRLNDTDTSRFVDVLYGTRVATFRNTMASGEDMDTVEPSIVFSFQDDSETRTALTIDHDSNVTIGGNLIKGSINLTFPTVGGTISTEGFSIALATALG